MEKEFTFGAMGKYILAAGIIIQLKEREFYFMHLVGCL